MANELISALMEKLLTTTIRKEISKLRTEFLAELRESQSALGSTIEEHGTRIGALETALSDMSYSLHRVEE